MSEKPETYLHVERSGYSAPGPHDVDDGGEGQLAPAAERIRQLEAEVAALRMQNDSWAEKLGRAKGQNKRMAQVVESTRALVDAWGEDGISMSKVDVGVYLRHIRVWLAQVGSEAQS